MNRLICRLQTPKVLLKIIGLLGCKREEIFLFLPKRENVEQVLDCYQGIPAPRKEIQDPFTALIFDSKFDEYKGVVAYVRVVCGKITKSQKIFMLGTESPGESLEIGVFKPEMLPQAHLESGDIGYIVTGLKDVAGCRVGDTIVIASEHKKTPQMPLPGYKEVKPMVFAGVFCKEGSDYPQLRDAMDKLKLNDASLNYEPESSNALGYGFRCGFLGLLHLESFRNVCIASII